MSEIPVTEDHKQAASMFLCWPTNAIDLAKRDSDLPELVGKLAAFIARREARAAAWQPIEKAPKDGTPIEACNTRHPENPPVIVRWSEAEISACLPDPHWCDAATRDGSALYYNANYFDFWKPTTPLPAPPVEAKSEVGG